MYQLYIFKLDKHNFFRIADRKILFNLTEFFLLLEAANSKLTVPEAEKQSNIPDWRHQAGQKRSRSWEMEVEKEGSLPIKKVYLPGNIN